MNVHIRRTIMSMHQSNTTRFAETHLRSFAFLEFFAVENSRSTNPTASTGRKHEQTVNRPCSAPKPDRVFTHYFRRPNPNSVQQNAYRDGEYPAETLNAPIKPPSPSDTAKPRGHRPPSAPIRVIRGRLRAHRLCRHDSPSDRGASLVRFGIKGYDPERS